ncbi:MAG: N-acetylmuramoyl-L-alanine amidase [Campylobacterota bacterium]|nr:N-acetylmuramoyl-L-alanine amidase [Campylobacterota bacterium]
MFTKPSRRVRRVFVHCSASDYPEHDNIETIRKWHLSRGFSEIGYHYFIQKDGQLSKGRSIEKTPAAQRGHNIGTIAICLHGLKKENFTESQFDTLCQLSLQIDRSYNGDISFHGHCEVAPRACPVFDYQSVLELDRYGSLGLENSGMKHLKTIEGMTAEKLPDLRQGSRGPAVELLQELLLLKIDGIFGPQTSRGLKAFKKLHELYPSDIVASHVWRLLLENEKVEHFE